MDASYKDLYELSHDGCIGFSTKLKPSGYIVKMGYDSLHGLSL